MPWRDGTDGSDLPTARDFLADMNTRETTVIELDDREQKLALLAVSLANESNSVGDDIADAVSCGATLVEVEAVAAIVDETTANSVNARHDVESVVATMDRGPWTHRSELMVGDHLTQIARREGTSGPTIVLCHSLGTDHRMWEPLVDALPPELDVLAYDVRNHGRERQVARKFSLKICAEDLRDLLDEMELSQVYLAGISMGGAIAQEFAIRFPERLSGLSLMATRGKGGSSGEARALAGERDGLKAQVGITLSRWHSPSFLAENGPWVRYVRQRVVGWNVDAWSQGWRALGNSNTLGRLAGVQVSTLCIAGEDDSSSPPHVLAPLADVLPHASLAVVPGPHLFPIEQPQAVAALLAKHHSTVP